MNPHVAERNVLLEHFPALSPTLRSWQKLSLQSEKHDPGQKIWLEDDVDEPTLITEELAQRLNLEQETEIQTLRDVFDDAVPLKETIGNLIVETSAVSFEDFTERVGPAFERLAEALQWQEFAILSDCRRSILAQDNDYLPVRAAEAVLQKAGLSKDNSHGLWLDRAAMTAVLGALFWIARCNASAPFILIAPKEAAAVATLCKYGNFHFEFYDTTEQSHFETSLKQSDFNVAPGNKCRSRYTYGSAIAGRAIAI